MVRREFGAKVSEPYGETVTPRRSVLGFGFFGVTAGLPSVLLLTSSSVSVHLTAYLVLVEFLILYSSFGLAIMVSSGAPQLLRLTRYLFTYVAMGVAPLAQIVTGQTSIVVDSSRLPVAAFMVLVANLCADVGYWYGQHLKPGNAMIRTPTNKAPVALSRVKSMTYLAFGGSGLYIDKVGIHNFFSSRQDLSQALSPGQLVNGLSSAASQAGPAAITAIGTAPALLAFVAWTLILRKQAADRTLSRVIVWLALMVLNLVVNNPISNSRYWFLTVAFAIAFSISTRPNAIRTSVIGGVIAAIIIFPYADKYRNDPDVSGGNQQQKQSIELTLATKDYDQMTMTANAMTWVSARGGHTYGAQLEASLFFFVPHTFWPGRSTDTGVLVAQILPTASQNQNLSSPLWVEFWVDFGWPGVVFGFLVFGYSCGRADQEFLIPSRSRVHKIFPIEVILPAVAGYEFILLRGPLLQAMARLAVMLLLVAFLQGRKIGLPSNLGAGHRHRYRQLPSHRRRQAIGDSIVVK